QFQINETDLEDYINTAKEIDRDDSIKLVNIEHEFGIFGGISGDYLIAFLETIKKPVVVTFHSVIPKPEERLKRVVRAIFDRCSAVIVMAETAIKVFVEDYGLSPEKFYVIPHGVPTIPPYQSEGMKNKLGLSGRIVLSTFGLINSGKGIEYVIKALPKIKSKYPNILYLVIGETHPRIRKEEGEKYRNKLLALLKKFDLADNVKFYNKYLTLREIIDYLKATDIYIYPALDPNQITSGTLAYALSAGKAVIGTPSLYAKEVLTEGRGFLVNFKDVSGIIKTVDLILSDSKLKNQIETNAYAYSRKMTWPNVAISHLEVFKKIIKISSGVGLYKFPEIKISHLLNSTDEVGIIQHAKHSVNDRRSGYTTDDNARALIAATMYQKRFRDPESLKLVNTYLSFLYHAQRKDGRFHNFMDYNRKFLDSIGSEDCFGRALWATGYVSSSSIYENVRMTAKFIFDNAVKNIYRLKSPRAFAFSILGLYYYSQKFSSQDILRRTRKMADRLVSLYKEQSAKDWKWFEKEITYSNGRLPEALFLAYELTKNKKYLEAARESLDFLTNLVILGGRLVLIGHNGWYNYKGKRAYFDQQPVDAASMVQTFLTVHRITKKEEYYDKAVISFNWFLGQNSIDQPLYDEITGGCFDGLLPNCVNLNQGAESTICYLLARMSFDR
ncbi:glycosyltransferase, partial [Patescibacteria group bacterium]|nr:glycosyltransferase [Patescibacteria group bacterium]